MGKNYNHLNMTTIIVTEIQPTYVIVYFGPVIIVATTVVTLPTGSIIVCLARHTTRTLRSFYRLSDILAS